MSVPSYRTLTKPFNQSQHLIFHVENDWRSIPTSFIITLLLPSASHILPSILVWGSLKTEPRPVWVVPGSRHETDRNKGGSHGSLVSCSSCQVERIKPMGASERLCCIDQRAWNLKHWTSVSVSCPWFLRKHPDSLLDLLFSFLSSSYIFFLIVLHVRQVRQVSGIEPRTSRMLGKLSTTDLYPQALDVFLIYCLHSFPSCPLHTNLSLSRAGFIY